MVILLAEQPVLCKKDAPGVFGNIRLTPWAAPVFLILRVYVRAA
jgi:hypothetical protein